MLHTKYCIPIFVFLTGCADVQVAYKNYKNAEEMEYINQARTACQRYGFTPGTDAFAACVDKNVNAEKDREALKSASQSDSKK